VLRVPTVPARPVARIQAKSQFEAVAVETWKNMQMYVKDLLPSRLSIGQKEVDALGF
jgi:hypothetical protein